MGLDCTFSWAGKSAWCFQPLTRLRSEMVFSFKSPLMKIIKGFQCDNHFLTLRIQLKYLGCGNNYPNCPSQWRAAACPVERKRRWRSVTTLPGLALHLWKLLTAPQLNSVGSGWFFPQPPPPSPAVSYWSSPTTQRAASLSLRGKAEGNGKRSSHKGRSVFMRRRSLTDLLREAPHCFFILRETTAFD